MKKAQAIVEKGNVTWFCVARDRDKPSHLIDTNEFVVVADGEALITDPGGMEIFPAVFSAISEVVDPRIIKSLFASHQDPDVISSLGLWLEVNPDIRCTVSWVWQSFIPHFGGQPSTFLLLPDEGGPVKVGHHTLTAVPAHYLHSSGNFSLYDPDARVLFSGDIGSALLPVEAPLMVEDFDSHIQHAEAFHKRWMGSNEAKRAWCERVAKLPIDFLCPQHGALYTGKDVERFINWFDELHVGVLGRG